jgi:hypothetical protein
MTAITRIRPNEVRQAQEFQRSLAQRMDALEKGNAVRSARAEWKRAVKVGRASWQHPLEVVEEGILSPEPTLFDSMKVHTYLTSLPGMGRVKANKVLISARISASKTLGGLSGRQMRELRDMLAWRFRS